MEFGVARFYHRHWPKSLRLRDFGVPFGSLLFDPEVRGVGAADNQLLSGFAAIRVPKSGFELFGEFGRNDRSENLRDALVEPEHNSAWLLGLFKVIGRDSLSDGFWTLRAEVGNGRVSALQDIGREQSTFYDHTTVTQGHTESDNSSGLR